MAKEYEMFPGIKVVDADDYSANSVKRLDASKFKQFDRSLNGATISAQAFLDKLSKHYSFVGSVCRSWIDPEAEVAAYVRMVNTDTTECVKISFADAAKCMGWKSFKVSADLQQVIPMK